MPNRRLHLAFSLSFVTAAALAQGPARAQAAQPPSATAAAPAAPAAASPAAHAPLSAELHRSALRREPNATPEPVGSWPEANRVVDEVGGWRSYLKEAHGSPASSPPSSQAPGAPATTPSPTTDRQALPPASARWHRSEQEVAQARARVQQLLLQPLSAAAAVEVALLNNAGLQAQLAELGITQAEVMQASRLPNPGFSYGRSSEGDKREIERGLHISLARILVLPLVREIEQRRLNQAERNRTLQVMALITQVRRAQVDAVAARERSRYMADVLKAAEASAELARRMARVGNFNKLQQAREQSFQADAVQGYARALREEMATRERLVRLLGLWDEDLPVLSLPDRLPDLPAALPQRPLIEREAMERRLDVQASKLQAEQTARQLGLTKTTRFINVLEVGGHLNSSNEGHGHGGWEVSLELPLFDWGTARVARAEAVYRQALSRTTQTAVNARSEVREAYGHWRATHDIARHQRDEVVPLKKRISEENLLRYNGMLIGVFELLADARAQIMGVSQYLDALRDFWVADADLEMALLGPVALGQSAGSTAGVRTPAAPAAAAPHAGH